MVVRRGGGKPAYIIPHKEGVSQGDPLAMALYGVALLPLAEGMEKAVPQAVTPIYADDTSAVGNAVHNAECMLYLKENGEDFGYALEPEKSVHVCRLQDEPGAKVAFYSRGLRIQFARGKRYLGGFVGSKEFREEWVREKVEKWRDGVCILANIAKRYPQAAYAAFTISYQNEWAHVQRTVPEVSLLLEPIERAIRDKFLPVLLKVDSIGAEMRQLLSHGLKQAGLGVRHPVESADVQFQTSQSACAVLTDALFYGTDFDLGEHREAVKQATTGARDMRVMAEEAFCENRARKKGTRERWRLKRAMHTGIWLSCVPSRLNNTEVSQEEWDDNIRLKYNLKPTNMPELCDGCGCKLTVEHALACKRGGLVHLRHNDVADEFETLAGFAFSPSCVSHEPLIFSEMTRSRGNNAGNQTQAAAANVEEASEATRPAEDEDPYVVRSEIRGDKGVHGFWKRGRTCIFDIRITDTECQSTRNQDPEKVLAKHELEKKRKYLAACHERRRDFTPLVYSVDGMASRETKEAEKQLARKLAWKWSREYSEMVGYVRRRMALAVVRANSLLLRGSRDRSNRARPFISDGAAMDAWQQWRERW